MKSAAGKNAAASRETAAFLLSFSKVHVLHYAAEKPVEYSTIIERLQRCGFPGDARAVQQLVRRLVRHGWLKSNRRTAIGVRAGPGYSLTPKGHAVLKCARKHLQEFAAARF